MAKEQLKELLRAQLVQVKVVNEDSSRRQMDSNSCIYIMGGSQNSLNGRFKVAAQLYRNAVARKILILHRPGITEYDKSLRRNLANDEWSIRKLIRLGVKSEDIEPVQVEEGLFGTWAEAKAIGKLASERGFGRVVVVSSSYHTKRVTLSFSQALGRLGVELYVYMSTDEADLAGLVMEYLKLGIYKSFVWIVSLSEKLGDQGYLTARSPSYARNLAKSVTVE